MKELKIALFEETYNTAMKYFEAKANYGEWEWFTDMYRHKFEALYTVIEEADLVLEYEEYKNTRNAEKHNKED